MIRTFVGGRSLNSSLEEVGLGLSPYELSVLEMLAGRRVMKSGGAVNQAIEVLKSRELFNGFRVTDKGLELLNKLGSKKDEE
jgi:hypothetical protein